VRVDVGAGAADIAGGTLIVPSPAQRAMAQPSASSSPRAGAQVRSGGQVNPASQRVGWQWPPARSQVSSAAQLAAVQRAPQTAPGPLQTQGAAGALPSPGVGVKLRSVDRALLPPLAPLSVEGLSVNS
jgi:hypothetical protein